MKKILISLSLAIVLIALASQPAWATGILIPKDEQVPPLAIKNQRVDIQISEQVARVRLDQVFQNSTARDLEATYIFPLPKGAAIEDFALYINGQRKSGELVEAQRARRIYQDIVRRMRDPGLLEYMDSNLIKMSVYPVPSRGTQRVEVAYTQVVPMDAGVANFTYPLRTGHKASRTLEDFTLSVTLSSKVPIKNIYSPSHKIGTSRKDEHHAVVGFEEERALLDKDFLLYWTISKKDFGLNLLTHRAGGEDGYFLILISPKARFEEKEVIEKDIVFVIDTSGSMSGEKIKQAKAALRYCVESLRSGDRFNIIRFASDVETMESGLTRADEQSKKRALAFIEKMQAIGGTYIDGALKQALSSGRDAKRPFIVLFLTDGKPTVGTQDENMIVSGVNAASQGARVFVFGVGDGVNTHLLDRISSDTGATSEYVRPEEDIEVKVSSLFNKLSSPVLANVKLDLGRIKVRDLYPREMPDLFQGSQFVSFGRYQTSGEVAIRLSGDVEGRRQEFVYEGEFPKTAAANEFIASLWATRKIGYLLDQIRLHGESRELVDEVIALSRRHGIATPYTSYLVVEDRELERLETQRRGAGPVREMRELRNGYLWRGKSLEEEAAEDALRAREGAELQQKTGAGAVETAINIMRLKDAKVGQVEAARIKKVGEKTFYFLSGWWVDEAAKEDAKRIEIKYASEAYFTLLEKKAELKDYFKLGDRLIIGLDGKVLVISDEGKEQLSEDEIKEILK